MIDRLEESREGGPGQPADHRHGELKEAESKRDAQHEPIPDNPDLDAARGGHGEGVHREAEGYQEEVGEAHRRADIEGSELGRMPP